MEVRDSLFSEKPKVRVNRGQSLEKQYIYIYTYLVVGLEHQFYDFPYIGNVVIPTDELIFFRGVGISPTRYIYIYIYIHIMANPEVPNEAPNVVK